MNQSLMRDNNGRIIGTIDEYWIDEDESYFDFKEDDIVYPRHNQGKSSPVTIWNMYDNK